MCFTPERLRACGCVCRAHGVSSAELVVHSGIYKYYSQHKCPATQPQRHANAGLSASLERKQDKETN